jgi:nitrous oxidase accessory protein NosD
MLHRLFFILCLFISLNASAQRSKTIVVSNLEDFVKAIESNRLIKIKADKFLISNLKQISNPNVKIDVLGDGFQLIIQNVNNLKIEGLADKPTKILTNFSNALVLGFEGCENITLTNLELAHSTAKTMANKPILSFETSKNITLGNVSLSKGTEGISLHNVQDANFDGLKITACHQGIMTIKNSRNIAFKNATFSNNQRFDLINIFDSEQIVLESCKINLNQTGFETDLGKYALINAPLPIGMNSPVIMLKKCVVEDNFCQFFSKTGTAVKTEQCVMDNNVFEFGYNLR